MESLVKMITDQVMQAMNGQGNGGGGNNSVVKKDAFASGISGRRGGIAFVGCETHHPVRGENAGVFHTPYERPSRARLTYGAVFS